MMRFAKSLALTLPLLFAISCANECNGPEDCKPGELCIRPYEPNGERGASQCVSGENETLRCSTDSDCGGGDSGQVVCRAGLCRIRGTTMTATMAAGDSGIVNRDAAARDALPPGVDALPGDPDAMSFPDAMTSSSADAAMSLADAGSSTVTLDAGTSSVADGG